MLKASNSRYNQDLQWVKMKVGHRFAIRLTTSTPLSRSIMTASTSLCSVLVGTWSALECSEVNVTGSFRLTAVDTSVFTTFYFGVLTNKEEVLARREYPNIQYLFRSSWGLSRKELCEYNSNMRSRRWDYKPYDRNDPAKRVCYLAWLP